MALTDKITISTTVYDESGYPIPDANIWIDGKFAKMTDNNGTVTIANVANSMSTVKITHVAKKDYQIMAVFLPKKVMMQWENNMLDEVVVKPLKKPTPKEAAPTETKKTNWLLWFAAIGLGVKAYQYFSSEKVVKAKL